MDMQQFLVLFREPDGRKDEHSPEAIARHRQNWQQWMERMNTGNHLAAGKPLALQGRIIKGEEKIVSDGPHTVGTEIIGGYLLLNARDIDHATELMKGCPIYEFDGYAEIRPVM